MKWYAFWWQLVGPHRFGVAAGVAAAATVASTAASAASSSSQSSASSNAADAQTAAQYKAMQASAYGTQSANQYLDPYALSGQYANYNLQNQLGLLPSGPPPKPKKADYAYRDPVTGASVVNNEAYNKAVRAWDAQLSTAGQYGQLKLTDRPDPNNYLKKNGKIDEKKYAAALKDWNDTTKHVAQAAGVQYKAAPDRQSFYVNAKNAKGKVIKNPDGTNKKVFDQASYDAAQKDYDAYLKTSAETYQQNYANSPQAQKAGALIKPYGQEQYQNDVGYTPMVNNDASWKASGDPTYMAPVNTLEDLQKTPGYMFGLNQGINSAQTSAAAGGSLMSGATLKALSDYGSGYASQKWQDYSNMQAQRYNDAFSRSQAAYLNAFNRDLANKQYTLGALTGQQQVGLSAAGAQSQNTMAAANAANQGYQNIGNAQAQNAINQGQAQANLYTGVGNAVSNGASGYALAQAGQNPNSVTSPTRTANGQNQAWDSNAQQWVSY